MSKNTLDFPRKKNRHTSTYNTQFNIFQYRGRGKERKFYVRQKVDQTFSANSIATSSVIYCTNNRTVNHICGQAAKKWHQHFQAQHLKYQLRKDSKAILMLLAAKEAT